MNIIEDPQFIPLQLDPIGRRLLFIRVDMARRRAASFLDERVLADVKEGAWVPWSALPASPVAPFSNAIFHIGHCGSTLMSRLLEEVGPAHALREPLALRTLADAWPYRHAPESRFGADGIATLLECMWSLWSRPMPSAGPPVIKATSNCNALVQPLLERDSRMRVILLDMPLHDYLAALLKAPASTIDGANAAPGRLIELQRHGVAKDAMLHAMSLSEQCAMGWLAEQMRFAALEEAFPSRVLRIDFPSLLEQPEATLERVVVHLGLDVERIEAALASEHWTRYSKAPDHPYGTVDRRHDLALAAQRCRTEIDQGLRWVEQRRDECSAGITMGRGCP